MANDNASIVSLKGPDRVRKRPAVMFGSDGIEGTVTAIKKLLNIFITEAALGYSDGIELLVKADNSIGVRSYDRGFLLDETIIDGKPAWHQDFCELYCGPRNQDNQYCFSLGSQHSDIYGKDETPTPKYQVDDDYGFNLCCVQYVSAFMHVEATRDGIKKTLDFEKGYSISDLQKEPTSDPTNTYIYFQIDSEVFDDVNFTVSEITDFLRDAAITIPGLKCEVCDERNVTKYTFLYPNGTVDYAAEVLGTIPLFTNEMEARGKDRYNYREYDAKVKVVFAFVNDFPNVICLHNYRKLEYGGHHLDAVKEQLLHYINWEFIWDFRDESSPNDEDNYYSRRRFELSFDDIKENVVLILETNCNERASMYINATKKSIKNRMITDMAHDLVSREFENYLRQNHEAIFSILKDIKRGQRPEIQDI